MTKDRIVGWDIFRILQIFPMVYLHTLEGFWAMDHEHIGYFSSGLFSLAYFYSHSFSTGGLNLVAISFFIIGIKPHTINKLKYLIPLLCIGILCLNIFYAFFYTGSAYFEWDIYHYLLLMVCLVYILNKYTSYIKIIFFVSLIGSLVPFWNIDLHIYNNSILEQILIGSCEEEKVGIWFVLPWVFWALLFWSYGVLFKDVKYINKLTNTSNKSFILSAVCVGLFLFFYSSYAYFYYCPVGPSFACYIHRPDFVALLSLLVSLIIIFTIFMNSTVNTVLQKYLYFVSFTKWNTNLGLTYLCHVFLLSISLGYFVPQNYSGTVFVFFVLAQIVAADRLSFLILNIKKRCS